jgi:hypothetical protein
VRYRIASSELNNIISKTYFGNDGDNFEKLFWTFLKERFPNCEAFWRYLVVPYTKRIESQIKDQNERLRPREGIAEDIERIASFHYSIFMNLIYAYDHLRDFRLSSFEDFYTHLGSVCDLAENFLLRAHLLTLECRSQKSVILQELQKDDFLKLAEKWYDDKYTKVYENYLKKGKRPQIEIPRIQSVLDEYFKGLEKWKEYLRHTQMIREYRNVIVHDVLRGKLLMPGDIVLVPKKEKIQDYKKWADIFAVRENIPKLRKDFINMKEQMILDIGTLEIILNELWAKPIDDLTKLFFDDKNEILLKKYNIDLA